MNDFGSPEVLAVKLVSIFSIAKKQNVASIQREKLAVLLKDSMTNCLTQNHLLRNHLTI